jgi:hypothetical protein
LTPPLQATIITFCGGNDAQAGDEILESEANTMTTYFTDPSEEGFSF